MQSFSLNLLHPSPKYSSLTFFHKTCASSLHPGLLWECFLIHSLRILKMESYRYMFQWWNFFGPLLRLQKCRGPLHEREQNDNHLVTHSVLQRQTDPGNKAKMYTSSYYILFIYISFTYFYQCVDFNNKKCVSCYIFFGIFLFNW